MITSAHMFHNLKSTTRKRRVCIWFAIENQHSIDLMTEKWSNAVELIQCTAFGMAIFDVCQRVQFAYDLPVYCVWFMNLKISNRKFYARFTSIAVICFELKFNMNSTVYHQSIYGINCMVLILFCAPIIIMHSNLMVVFLIGGNRNCKL